MGRRECLQEKSGCDSPRLTALSQYIWVANCIVSTLYTHDVLQQAQSDYGPAILFQFLLAMDPAAKLCLLRSQVASEDFFRWRCHETRGQKSLANRSSLTEVWLEINY